LKRKRNRQSEAEAQGDVEKHRSIAAETVQKLPEKCWNFDASGVFKLATITSGSAEITETNASDANVNTVRRTCLRVISVGAL